MIPIFIHAMYGWECHFLHVIPSCFYIAENENYIFDAATWNINQSLIVLCSYCLNHSTINCWKEISNVTRAQSSVNYTAILDWFFNFIDTPYIRRAVLMVKSIVWWYIPWNIIAILHVIIYVFAHISKWACLKKSHTTVCSMIVNSIEHPDSKTHWFNID